MNHTRYNPLCVRFLHDQKFVFHLKSLAGKAPVPSGKPMYNVSNECKAVFHRVYFSSSFIRRSPEVPFVTGTSSDAMARPIIGPPLIILPVFSGRPPAASINSDVAVPTPYHEVRWFFNAFSGYGNYTLNQRFIFLNGFVNGKSSTYIAHYSTNSNR